MNKKLLSMILLLVFSVQANQDSVFEALEKRDLKAVRHNIWRTKVSVEKLNEYIAFTKDLIRYHEERSSVLKSLPDLARTLVGAGICVGGLFCGRFIFPLLYEEETDEEIVARLRKVNYVGTAALCLAGAYLVSRGLACPHAQSKVKEAQAILRYLETLLSERSSSSDSSKKKAEGLQV